MFNNYILSTMLRFRSLSKKGNRFELVTKFQPSEDDILDCNLFTCGCVVVFDFTRKVQCLEVSKFPYTRGKYLPLPSLSDIRQEIGYMFQLLDSLSPYEISFPQTQKSQDLPPVSA